MRLELHAERDYTATEGYFNFTLDYDPDQRAMIVASLADGAAHEGLAIGDDVIAVDSVDCESMDTALFLRLTDPVSVLFRTSEELDPLIRRSGKEFRTVV